MTEKQEFKKLFRSIFTHTNSPVMKAVFNGLWSYFQSKQQREDYEFTRKEIIEWLHEQNWKCEQLEKLLLKK